MKRRSNINKKCHHQGLSTAGVPHAAAGVPEKKAAPPTTALSYSVVAGSPLLPDLSSNQSARADAVILVTASPFPPEEPAPGEPATYVYTSQAPMLLLLHHTTQIEA